MGFVDRGGGRESKGSSLRRSSKNPGTAVAKGKSAPKSTAAVALTARVMPALPAVWQPLRDADVRCNTMAAPHPTSEHARESKASNETAAMLHDLISALRTLRHTSSTTGEQTRRVQVDAAVSLLSRSLQDDVQGLLRRACEEGGLRALLCWSRELERQASLLEHCRSHNKLYAQSITAQTAVDAHDKKKTVRFAVEVATTATTTTKDKESENGADEGCLLYCLVGIHVGNIVRTHRKIQEQWVGDMAVLARQPEVLGVVSGLNFAREPGTHYAQEWLLKECWRVAAELRLPLVIFVEGEGSTGETAGEGSNNANNNNNNNDGGAGGEESGASRVAELLQELIAAAQTTTKANEEEEKAEKKDDDGSTRSAASCPTAVVLHNGLRVLTQSAALRGLVQRQRVLATAAAAPHPSSPPFYVLTSAQDVEYVMQRQSDERKRAVGTDMPPLLPSLHYDKDNEKDDGAVLSLTQLLLGTNSPWGTPQNIDDAYLRTQRNEPANFPWVLRTLYAAMQQCTSEQRAAARDGPVLDVEDVADVLVCNFLRVFFAHSEATSAPHDEAQDNSAGTSATPYLLYRGSALKHVAPGTNADPNETEAAAAHGEDNARLAKPSVIAHADPIEDVKHAVDSHLHAKEEDAEWRALLAQAAREREAIEAERAAQEAQAALAPKPERHRQKKVNVKANNRSNFTHFRNKDFTPRLTKAAAGAQTQTQHQQQQQQQSASDSDDDDDETEEDEEATTAAAANTMRPKAKPKKKREARALPSHQPQANSTLPSSSSSSSQSDSAEDEAQDEAAMEAAMQPSRSQRRKMQRRRKNKAQQE